MWSRYKSFTENWVGYHPGYVYYGVVDAHPDPAIVKGKALSTRLQIRDASFNVDPVAAKHFQIGKSKKRK